jgi:hypothetical protein
MMRSRQVRKRVMCQLWKEERYIQFLVGNVKENYRLGRGRWEDKINQILHKWDGRAKTGFT